MRLVLPAALLALAVATLAPPVEAHTCIDHDGYVPLLGRQVFPGLPFPVVVNDPLSPTFPEEAHRDFFHWDGHPRDPHCPW